MCYRITIRNQIAFCQTLKSTFFLQNVEQATTNVKYFSEISAKHVEIIISLINRMLKNFSIILNFFAAVQ